ncbi:MAG: hypothetical protein IKX57_01390, partial [Oscillospiraceae bacterium]|nr:hypothetical protein [Oscillospiraceae bacterium]
DCPLTAGFKQSDQLFIIHGVTAFHVPLPIKTAFLPIRLQRILIVMKNFLGTPSVAGCFAHCDKRPKDSNPQAFEKA